MGLCVYLGSTPRPHLPPHGVAWQKFTFDTPVFIWNCLGAIIATTGGRRRRHRSLHLANTRNSNNNNNNKWVAAVQHVCVCALALCKTCGKESRRKCCMKWNQNSSPNPLPFHIMSALDWTPGCQNACKLMEEAVSRCKENRACALNKQFTFNYV